jgi:hypothetical protein
MPLVARSVRLLVFAVLFADFHPADLPMMVLGTRRYFAMRDIYRAQLVLE